MSSLIAYGISITFMLFTKIDLTISENIPFIIVMLFAIWGGIAVLLIGINPTSFVEMWTILKDETLSDKDKLRALEVFMIKIVSIWNKIFDKTDQQQEEEKGENNNA